MLYATLTNLPDYMEGAVDLFIIAVLLKTLILQLMSVFRSSHLTGGFPGLMSNSETIGSTRRWGSVYILILESHSIAPTGGFLAPA